MNSYVEQERGGAEFLSQKIEGGAAIIGQHNYYVKAEEECQCQKVTN